MRGRSAAVLTVLAVAGIGGCDDGSAAPALTATTPAAAGPTASGPATGRTGPSATTLPSIEAPSPLQLGTTSRPDLEAAAQQALGVPDQPSLSGTATVQSSQAGTWVDENAVGPATARFTCVGEGSVRVGFGSPASFTPAPTATGGLSPVPGLFLIRDLPCGQVAALEVTASQGGVELQAASLSGGPVGFAMSMTTRH